MMKTDSIPLSVYGSKLRLEMDKLTKTRLKTWVTCARKFYYSYIEDIETEETEAMVRGKDIHKLIEDYYENILEYSKDNDTIPDTLFDFLENDDVDWQQYLDPYLIHFLSFERRRWENSDNMDEWAPIAIEEEGWEQLHSEDLPVSMGYTDIILPAGGFTEFMENEGGILIDVKTGKTSSEKYQNHENGGVDLDLAFYRLLFESEYDIVGIGAYYPKGDDLVLKRPSEARAEFIKEVSEEIASADKDDITDFPLKTGPLCAWGEDENSRCEYYDMCESNWGEPIDNKEKTVQMIKDGKTDAEIADEYNTSEDAVDYWVRQKRWYRYR